ncbi:MAG: glycosyltransferase family 2 protein [Candidatus Sericytochromatia bacterium]|nr:glycosyltransferase family 2 protein [Candidatus Tanganyikabacteria bacterium]
MKRISVITPCYNEEQNIAELHARIRSAMAQCPEYDWEHILIDNASSDGSVAVLRDLAASEPRVKVILNVRNFGHIRSPYHALLQASGDAAVMMASDLQDPPELIPEFLSRWEEGYRVVLAVKEESEESPLFFAIRSTYYKLIERISDVRITKNATGFGLYDRRVVDILREIRDPYPYFRGLVADLGFESAKVPFRQPARKRGITKNNLYTLYDIGMLGITYHSKVPIRIAAMAGFALAMLSLLAAIGYLVYKLIFWYQFPVGQAPVLVGMFFFASVQLFFIGILGEYIGAIHTQVLNRPLVIERERINFDAQPAVASPGVAIAKTQDRSRA